MKGKKKRRRRERIEKKSVKSRVEKYCKRCRPRMGGQEPRERIDRNTTDTQRSFNFNCEKTESRREGHVLNLNPPLVSLQ